MSVPITITPDPSRDGYRVEAGPTISLPMAQEVIAKFVEALKRIAVANGVADAFAIEGAGIEILVVLNETHRRFLSNPDDVNLPGEVEHAAERAALRALSETALGAEEFDRLMVRRPTPPAYHNEPGWDEDG